jgi:hypothetical protein
MKIASTVRKTIPDVLIVRPNVLLIPLLILSRNPRLGYNVLYSEYGQNNYVSLMENPMIVKIAAIKFWSTSIVKGKTP